ncbi:hypothetical protein [Bacillus nitratireducens]|uniref:hypothetical protein n=1 Tax=Bacillus nitratireducens TaxID=2026193 RepID=UPI002ECF3C88|nr:hypothetical protein [Bacillus nitratireducens]
MNSHFSKQNKCCHRLFPAFPPAVPPVVVIAKFLYVSSPFDSTVEIYNISNPTAPVRVGEFGAGDLNVPNGLAVFTLFG